MNDGLFDYTLEDVREVQVLRERFGQEVVLVDDEGESVVFRILTEFSLGKVMYAALQTDELERRNEFGLYRIGMNRGGEPELETIEDDDEWENVSELVDEMLFS
ncbi:DUF1292 domain-containing protein [Paenibacillus sp. y28]|uniref:DUF1292 domain-containing protein n=1 Tax=Paenibacillus sp. y28 TaxID=3129110 RepID=UPI003015BD24